MVEVVLRDQRVTVTSLFGDGPDWNIAYWTGGETALVAVHFVFNHDGAVWQLLATVRAPSKWGSSVGHGQRGEMWTDEGNVERVT